MYEWLTEHIPATVIILLTSLSGLVEITPIKINPLSWVFTKLGRALNKEMLERLNEMQTDLSKHIQADDEKWVKQSRLRILRFNDELIHSKGHSKEHFDEILDDITFYHKYCEEHPDYKNDKAVMSIENVKRVYKELESKNGFL